MGFRRGLWAHQRESAAVGERFDVARGPGGSCRLGEASKGARLGQHHGLDSVANHCQPLPTAANRVANRKLRANRCQPRLTLPTVATRANHAPVANRAHRAHRWEALPTVGGGQHFPVAHRCPPLPTVPTAGGKFWRGGQRAGALPTAPTAGGTAEAVGPLLSSWM